MYKRGEGIPCCLQEFYAVSLANQINYLWRVFQNILLGILGQQITFKTGKQIPFKNIS